MTVWEGAGEHEERHRTDEVQDGRQHKAHPPRPHPRWVRLCQVGGLPWFHVDGEQLPAHLIAKGRPHDGHGVEQSQVDGNVLRIDDVVNVGGAQGKEGRGSSPDQEEAQYEQEVGEVVTLGAGISKVLASAEL